ncbi:MAG: transposase [Synergistaceae bacterium]|nr:transposase [Synergistaceae bacterium]
MERAFGWLDQCRRLWKNRERLIETTLSMVKLAFVSLLLKKFLDTLLEASKPLLEQRLYPAVACCRLIRLPWG